MKSVDKLKSINTFTDAIMSHGNCGISKALASCIKIQLAGMDDQGRKKTYETKSGTEVNTKVMAKLLKKNQQTIMKWAREGVLGAATPRKSGTGKQSAYLWDRDKVMDFIKDNGTPGRRRK